MLHTASKCSIACRPIEAMSDWMEYVGLDDIVKVERNLALADDEDTPAPAAEYWPELPPHGQPPSTSVTSTKRPAEDSFDSVTSGCVLPVTKTTRGATTV